MAGAEAPQVYVHETRPALERPEHELVGFEKVHLQPGEMRRVSLQLDHKAFSYYSVVQKSWAARSGTFEIRVGTASKRIHLARPFHLAKSFVWIGLQAPVEAEVY
jgi:beta-glucosidase